MRKKKLTRLQLTVYLILIVILAAGSLLLLKFLSQKNVQKIGTQTEISITAGEIGGYLDMLNAKRFTDEEKAPIREIIKKEFAKYGYTVTEQKTDGEIRKGYAPRVFVNIIAQKGDLDHDHILIGAHYDSVPETTGMDDNGSGVAAMLAIAKHTKSPNIKFIAFDGEEYGFIGSNYYLENTSIKPGLMVSLETMGYYSEKSNSQSIPRFYNLLFPDLYNRLKESGFKGNFSAVVCSNNAVVFCNNYESAASGMNLEVYTIPVPGNRYLRSLFIDLFRSDHTPFLLKGIPSLMITDTANFRSPHYHLASDTRETVNEEFIAKQANSLLNILSFKNRDK